MIKKTLFLIIILLFAVGTVFGFGLRASLEGYSTNNISGDENNMALGSRLLAGFTFGEKKINDRLTLNFSAGFSGFNIMGSDNDIRLDYSGAFTGLTLTQSFSDSKLFLRFGAFANFEVNYGFRSGGEQILLFSTTAGLDVALSNLHGYIGATYALHKILNPEREIRNVSRTNIFLGLGLVFPNRKQKQAEENEKSESKNDKGGPTISVMEGSGLVIL